MRLIIVTGLSGSGKSVAIRQLEDSGCYCVDNLPAQFLTQVCSHLARTGHEFVAVSIDARSEVSFPDVPAMIQALRQEGHDVRLLFLTAATDELVQRFSETRRQHPMSRRATAGASEATIIESIESERELLEPLVDVAHVIDTGGLHPNTLRDWVRQFADAPRGALTLAFESFAFKHGLPVAADLVFDVRNLPNPYYDLELRPLTGCDAPVAEFLAREPEVGKMIDDIANFIATWLPSYRAQNRYYLTVAIGCTGGRHRSVYVVEALARRLANEEQIVVRHRIIGRRGQDQ
ncbi:MAG: RNase adapter RapZ [Burkholderiaceae bacterium]